MYDACANGNKEVENNRCTLCTLMVTKSGIQKMYDVCTNGNKEVEYNRCTMYANGNKEGEYNRCTMYAPMVTKKWNTTDVRSVRHL